MNNKFDMAIIGGGPGGYVAALRGAQLKRKVVLFEKATVGGTCINWGCIPTKYLLQQTKFFKELKENENLDGPLDAVSCNWMRIQHQRRLIIERFVRGIELLLKKNGVLCIRGEAELLNERQIGVRNEAEKNTFEAEKIILATGSKPAVLPFALPDGESVITSKDGLVLTDIPRDMIVIGAGAIGLEIGSIYQRLGCQITVLELLSGILPGSDREMTKRLERSLKSQGLKIFTEMEIHEVLRGKNKVEVKGTCLKDSKPFAFEAEKVLSAVGRIPNSAEFLKMGSTFLDAKGFVKVDANLETECPGIFAIGDLVGGKLLAHKASHDGILAAENAWGAKKGVNYDALPMAVYTEPEFSSVGLTEQEALKKRMRIQSGTFSLQANGRALTMGKPDGMVKIIANEEDEIIGAHILAPHASELLAELTLCLEKRLKLQDISSTYHIHPTLSEAVMEAALKAKGKALHILNT
jgi:dihydrolipoamide dehydrogenase